MPHLFRFQNRFYLHWRISEIVLWSKKPKECYLLVLGHGDHSRMILGKCFSWTYTAMHSTLRKWNEKGYTQWSLARSWVHNLLKICTGSGQGWGTWFCCHRWSCHFLYRYCWCSKMAHPFNGIWSTILLVTRSLQHYTVLDSPECIALANCNGGTKYGSYLKCTTRLPNSSLDLHWASALRTGQFP